MKRIAGAVVVLMGFSGCITFAPPDGQAGNRTATEQAIVRGSPPTPGGADANYVPTAASPQWTYGGPGPAWPTVAYMAGKATPPGQDPNTPAVQPTALPPRMPVNPPATQTAQAGPNTPPPLPAMPAGMPVVVTPPSAKDTSNDSKVVQASASNVSRGEGVVPASRTEVVPSAQRQAPNASSLAVKNSMPADVKQAPGGGKAGGPLFRMVNTRRITLNFEVKDVGPSGLSSVELWYTQDSREWRKYDASTQAQTYVVEVEEEGMYGFTLLAKSGTGLGKESPKPGDQPQVWVVVDLTRPKVALCEVTPNLKSAQQMATIRWKASDKNLGRRPITLYYAEKEEGPWKVIATGLENNGAYLWQVPRGVPSHVLVRVEATDMAGNVAQAQSPRPLLLMDSSKPCVDILNVEAGAAH
jgi:hypothetical protein